MASAAKKDVIEIRFPSRKEYVGVVRLAISGLGQRCNFTIDEIEDLKIAITEACTNAVVHAYNGKPGEIIVRCHPAKNTLTVEVNDKGVGFNPKTVVPGTKGKGKTPSLGLGLTFIKSVTNDLKIKSVPKKGTTLTFRKKHA